MTVCKLNDTNYQSWKFKVRMLLIREGTWKCVQEGAPDELNDEWVEKDEKAQSTISLTVSDNQIVHISSCTTAKGMWDELQKVHERTNLTNKLYLMRKLYQSKLKPEQDMQEYIRCTLEVVDRLRGIGEDIRDFHVAALLLSGLPDSYETLVTALDARPDDELTLEYVKGKLVDEYRRKSGGATSESALKTHDKAKLRAKPTASHSKQHETRECFYCKKPGHLKKDCRAWKAKMNEYQKSSTLKASSAVNVTDDSPDDHVAFTNNVEPLSSSGWYIDSGATSHMTNDRSFFAEFTKTKPVKVTVANGQYMMSEGVGDGYLHCRTSNDTKRILVKDVLFVPTLESNLLSVKKLAKQGNVVKFEGDHCFISRDNRIYAEGKINSDLYQLVCERANAVKSEPHQNCVHLWHRRLGHRDPEAVLKLSRDKLADGIEVDSCGSLLKCISCIKGKMARQSFPKVSSHQAKQSLDLVHTDVCGPMSTETPGHKRYFLTFIDDYSRYTVVYLLHSKAEVPVKLQEYIAYVSNKFGRKPKVLRSDNGSEYTGSETQAILKKSGIQFQTTVPYTPEQNGIAERKNRTLCESGRSMLFDSGLPTKYWGEAIMTACYVQNRLPTRAVDKTPYELWNDEKPDVKHIRVFGSKAYAHVPAEKRTKWDSHSFEGVLVGYSETSKGYRILNLNTGKVTISRTVVFDEGTVTTQKFIDVTGLVQSDSAKIKHEHEAAQQFENQKDSILNLQEVVKPDKHSNTEADSDESSVNEPVTDSVPADPPPIRRSVRQNRGMLAERLTYLVHCESDREPESWEEMEKLPNAEKQKWISAADEEMKSLNEQETWKLTELPAGKHAVGCKWVFKVKHDGEGKVDRYKARLVAKGYSQKFGEDYDATFAPVAKQTTFRTLLAIAAAKRMKVRNYDIKSAFLNGDVTEDIYMTQPERYVKEGSEDLVCKLKKSLYGLKQSARAWNTKINDIMLLNGFVRSKADQCLYSKFENSKWMYVLLYVDDLIVLHEDDACIRSFGGLISEHFKTKDLGDISYYLGIQIERDVDGSFLLNQSAKITALLDKFSMKDVKGVSTPMDTSYTKLEGEYDRLPDNEQYRQAVGAMLYVATTTRPDIAAAIGLLCRRVSNPRQRDWNAVKRVMRYLKQTADLKLKISAVNLDLVGYVDADWAGDVSDRKSTSGYLYKLGESPVSWSSKKQASVALSSTEAEYISAALASQEVAWIRQLLCDLGVPATQATLMYEDNQGCIKLAAGDKMNARTKHIDVRYHHLRDLVERHVIELTYCETNKMIADALTKPLPRPKFEELRAAMGLV